MAEYDPMEELGLTHDKQIICGCLGFLQLNNSTRDICKKFIRNGDKFYDVVSRYEDVVTYILGREENRPGNAMRNMAPFLKAFGATDYGMLKECKDSAKLMPNAVKVMNYLTDLMPTFVSTSSLEHNVMALCEALNLPISIWDYSTLGLDGFDMSRADGRAIRDFSSAITSLKLPTHKYALNVPVSLPDDEAIMVSAMDRIFDGDLKKLEISSVPVQMKSVGANEKAYALLDLRKKTMIDFDGTVYIGGETMDYQSMDLVREGGGLSVAFNGSEFAVHGCNVSVMARDCTVAAVLAAEFYNLGIEGVFDLVSNWDRASLKKRECPDPNVMQAMLDANPKLPEVQIVNRKNADKIALKSDAYRKKMLLQYA